MTYNAWARTAARASLCTDYNHLTAVHHGYQLTAGAYPAWDGLIRGIYTMTECWNGEINIAGDTMDSAWAVLNTNGVAPNLHPLDRSADNYEFDPFYKTQFEPADWDIGRSIN